MWAAGAWKCCTSKRAATTRSRASWTPTIPLIPQGSELIATLMLEIEDARKRERELYRLAGIEEATYIELAGERIRAARPNMTSAPPPTARPAPVHWVRFTFTDEEKKKFADPAVPAVLGVAHAAYGHMAVIPPQVRDALAKDFA